jgi:hypothetical protein
MLLERISVETLLIYKIWALLMTVLYLISEVLGFSKKIKQGSIYEIIWAFIKGEAIRVKPELDKLLRKDESP